MEPRVLNDYVVLQVPDGAVLQSVLGLKVATIHGQDYAAVPYDLPTVRFFANQGVKLPHPITTKYNWPGRFTPFQHQIETAEFLTLNPRAFLLSGMGTGKTKAALWAADYLMRLGQMQKCIIFSPLSTLDRVWAQEIFETLPHRRFQIVYGPRQKRFDLLDDRKADFYITNHDAGEILHDKLAERPDISHVLLDECFSGETLVATPNGKRRIDTLRVKDIIHTSWGPMPVTHVFARQTMQMVRLHFEDDTYVDCTPEHPFATDRGWAKAQEAEGARCLRDSDLLALRRSAYRQSVRDAETSSVLQCDMPPSSDPRHANLRRLREILPGDEGVRSTPPGEVLLEVVLESVLRHRSDSGRSDLCPVWDGISSTAFTNTLSPPSVLFTELCPEMGVDAQPQQEACSGQDFSETARKTGVEQRGLWPRRQAASGDSRTTSGVHQEPPGERDRDDSTRKSSSAPASDRVYPQSCDLTREANARVSDLLQSGLWARRVEDRSGGGWREPQQPDSSGAGSEKRSETLGVRVVRVENLEPGSPRWVFNLEVAGPHDYVAGGKVVHNCASFRNMPTKRAKTMFSIVNRQHPRTCWGLTGTPTPTAPTDCYGQIRIVTPERYKSSFKALQNELMYQVSQFRWVPRTTAAKRVHELMQPSIRFALEDCIDLPETIWSERECELSDEQAKAYKEMKATAMAEVKGEQVTAVNAAIILGKLLQASCIAYGTRVLSEQRGWIEIQTLTSAERVWDGEEWVNHGGVVCQGRKQTICCQGVRMTPDHRVLTATGWRTAEELTNANAGKRSDWAEVRLPDGVGTRGVYRSPLWPEVRRLEVPVRLWEGRHAGKSILTRSASDLPSKLRMSYRRSSEDSRYVEDTSVPHLVGNDPTMQKPSVSVLDDLRRAWDSGLRTLGILVREFLGRYGGYLRRSSVDRPNRQRRPLQPRELSLGRSDSTGEQHSGECSDRYSFGPLDDRGSRTSVWAEGHHSACSDLPVRLAGVEGLGDTRAEAVFDILDCGPRNQFVVWGDAEPLIVHNCGIMYNGEGRGLEMDFGPRYRVLEEIIEECNEKVIVFVPFTAALEAFAARLKKKWSVAVVDGSVPSGQRNTIFREFQTLPNPHVLVAHPKTMAHGLNLIAATTIVWLAPTPSNEIFSQANARIVRPGQKHVTNVVMIQGSPAERGLYKTLKERGRMQDLLLQLAKGG